MADWDRRIVTTAIVVWTTVIVVAVFTTHRPAHVESDRMTHLRRASPGEGLRFLRSVVADPPDTCVLWPYGRGGGYGSTTFRGRKTQTHVVVCELSHGPRPAGMDAAHRCGVSACVNPRHIRWATRSENELDKRLHGTGLQGERNPRAVLTAADVAEIREQYSIGELHQWQLGIIYGVRQNTISRVVTGARWAS